MSKDSEIQVTLTMSKEEFALLKQRTDGLLLLPSDPVSLSKKLTTGKLGNSNRIMLPKKLLTKLEVPDPVKKVDSSIFRVDGDVFLLIKLNDAKQGVPVFGEDK
jgi:hypothetical protein